VKNFLLFTCLIWVSGIALAGNNGEFKTTLMTADIKLDYPPAYYSELSFSPDGQYMAYTVNGKIDNVWSSELMIRDLSNSKNYLAISSNETKKYAVYSAFAYSLAWDNGIVKMSVSDGDVDTTVLHYDMKKQKIVDKSHFSFDDYENTEQSELSKKIVSCFPEWNAEIVASAENMLQSGWIIEGKTAFFQARHVDADNHVWQLDLESCYKKIIVEIGDNKQEDFKGWLSGTAYYQGYLVFSLNTSGRSATTGKYKKTSLIYAKNLQQSSDQAIQLFKMKGVMVRDLGVIKQQKFVLFRSEDDACDDRIFRFDSTGILRELTIEGRNICEVVLEQTHNHMAVISKPTGNPTSEPRNLTIFDLKRVIK